jgi:hypothetical protein
MFFTMTNQRILIVASILSLMIFNLSLSNGYTLSGQLDDNDGSSSSSSISISSTPFYTATNGTIIGERVIGIGSEDPRTEVSFIEDGIVENVGNVSNIGTFVEHMISSDVIRGNGEGIMRSADGNSTIGWNAYDIGKRSDDGSFIFKGIIFFHILSPEDDPDEFNFLDNQVGVYKNIVNFDSIEEYVGRGVWMLN